MDFFNVFFVRKGGDKNKYFLKNLLVIASHKKPAAVTFQIRKYSGKMLAGYYII